MAEEIVIDIAANGDVTVEGKGIAGPDCKALTKGIEEALGAVQHTTLKPDYHKAKTVLRKVGA